MMRVEPAYICVRAIVCVCTLSNMNISENSRPITIKFYLTHEWGWEKTASGFGPDWIRILGFIAKDSSHRVIMGKLLWPL